MLIFLVAPFHTQINTLIFLQILGIFVKDDVRMSPSIKKVVLLVSACVVSYTTTIGGVGSSGIELQCTQKWDI